MTLHVFADVIQGTDEWLALRRGMVTASIVGDLITPATLKPANNDTSRGRLATIVAERITGWTDEVYVSNDMMRGTFDEPRARHAYSTHYGVTVDEVGFLVREFDGLKLGYSPDGLVNSDGLIESKSRRPKKHIQTVLANEVPKENLAQIQAGLLVSGREWCDYVSYCGGMRMWVTRVYPDPAWQDAIVEAVRAFEEAATAIEADFLRAIEGFPMTERAVEEVLI